MRMVFMNLTVCNTEKNTDVQAEAKLVDVLEQLGFNFNVIQCCDSRRICINVSCDNEDCEKICCNSDIIVQTSTKDAVRIRQCDIIYIAIENRKSAVYVDGKRIETNYSLDYWKKSLNPKIFAQPHSSFLVNLCYVEEVTKDFVKIKHKEKGYSVYTSSRKLNSFKKAFLECNK